MNELVLVQMRKVSASLAVFDIQGEVTASAEMVFMDALRLATENGVQDILLNFSGLKYMNSAGIGLMVSMIMQCSRNQQRLMANGLNEHYQHIFRYTRLHESIRIFDSEAEVLSALGQPFPLLAS